MAMNRCRLLGVATVQAWRPLEASVLRATGLVPRAAPDWVVRLLAAASDGLGGPKQEGLADLTPAAILGRWAPMPFSAVRGPTASPPASRQPTTAE
jgi:hypothetical protein